jgi:transcriptional regulator with XRE-family HTH domain
MKKRRGPKQGSKYTGTNPYQFGRTLAEIRRRKGLTQEELAQLLGTTRRIVSYYERDVTNPSIEVITKIATALNVPVEHFLEHMDKQAQQKPTKIDRGLSRRCEEAQKLPQNARLEIKRFIDAMLKSYGMR